MAKSLSIEQSLFMQRSTLTYSADHAVLEPRVNVQRPDSSRDVDKRIKVEILNIYIINRRASIANGAGEIPIIRKSMTAAERRG